MLITVAIGEVKRIVGDMRAIEGIVPAIPVMGLYDIIALVEAPDMGALNGIVVEKVHGVKEILSTCTAVHAP